MQPFVQRLHRNGGDLSRRAVDVLQVNMGRYCNQACIHCHVESGPTRKEMMSRETVEAVLRFLADTEKEESAGRGSETMERRCERGRDGHGGREGRGAAT